MKKSIGIIFLMLTASVFAGSISGSVLAPGSSTDSAFVIVFHDFESLSDSGLYYSMAGPPAYNYTVTDPELIDAFDFHVMAIMLTGAMPASGSPAGQYPSNPIQLTGGSIAGIDVPVDTIGDIHGHITYSGPIDSVMIGVYDGYPLLFGMPPTLESSHHITSLDYTIDEIPAGPKSFRAWIDGNGNGMFDSTAVYEEVYTWYVNETGGMTGVGGGFTTSVNMELPYENIGESNPRPEVFGVNCFPNPFNAAATILVYGSGQEMDLDVYDMLGNKVETLIDNVIIDGITALRWNPSEDLAGGTYLLKVKGNGITKTKSIIYLK